MKMEKKSGTDMEMKEYGKEGAAPETVTKAWDSIQEDVSTPYDYLNGQ